VLAEAGVRILPVKRIDEESVTRRNLLGAETGIEPGRLAKGEWDSFQRWPFKHDSRGMSIGSLPTRIEAISVSRFSRTKLAEV